MTQSPNTPNTVRPAANPYFERAMTDPAISHLDRTDAVSRTSRTLTVLAP